MTKEYELSQEMRQALIGLRKLMREEKVPDPAQMGSQPDLSPDGRRLALLLKMFDDEGAAVQSKLNSAGAPPVRGPYDPTPDGGPPQPTDVSGEKDKPTPLRLGAHKFVPKDDFSAEAPLEDSSMASSPPAVRPSAEEKTIATPDHPPPAPPPPQTSSGPSQTAPVPGPAPTPVPPPPQTVSQDPLPLIPPVTKAPGNNKGGTGVAPIETVKKSFFLKNAKVGEFYESHLEIDGMKSIRMEIDHLKDYHHDDAKKPGIIFDDASATFRGTPVASGDFQFRLRGLLHGRPAEITAHLAVIPDPRSLWISKDSDRNAPFWKPDQDFAMVAGDLLCVAVSKRGRSHAKDGGFRDDDFGILQPKPGGWHVVAVADGAGSAKFSRRGSKVAVDAVLKDLPPLLEEHLDPDLDKLVAAYMSGRAEAERDIKIRLYNSIAAASLQAAKAVESEAGSHEEPAGAFSTTLVLCIAKRLAAGWFFAGFSVGDGGAAVFDAGDCSVAPLTAPDSGEFAGQTRFLHRSEFSSWEDVSRRIFFNIRKHFTALVLMTDGITDPKFPTEVSFSDAGKWRDFWNGDLAAAVHFSRDNPDLEKQFTDWLDFWSPGNHDDRTIAVLVP